MWDIVGEKNLSVLSHGSQVNDFAFSPGGKIFASSGATVKLWDITSGKAVFTLSKGPQVLSVAFSPDSKTLATSYVPNAQFNNVQLWDVTSGKESHTLGVDRGYGSIAFSPDGKMLASASHNGVANLWDVATGKMLAEIKNVYTPLR
jgi:WD40 repeat protein